ncbi:DUF4259 domain-containing protein [Actinoplanes utahensis]|uniref:Uncharacterized protein n=1 Tax=Actinoplanes utahensis TaxID=1869 RepID=A0A0A6UI74_ACTUT|nr:DUF4259 domain-containing protein [Actinoplanes utahensis]KHD74019.1 hypothetical protein MB27_31305 [Actinoplanes utahensis]GIF31482.1 hypothetical protein Aut01nite_44680 [Actinoplanes utahensis]
MAAFGTGAFSSDGALRFLKEIAEKIPERRAATLERLFQSVKDQPELVGHDFLPDQVVAAAAIVAATALGGDQFDERLQALATDDPAFDARLPTLADGLAGAALEALGSVADRWRQDRSKDTGAVEAGQTIAALSQVLANVSVLDDLDAIWNDACDYGADGDVPEGTPLGIQHLASLLRIHGSVMGGGLAFALEVNEPFRVRRAVEALHYFGLTAAAELLEDTLGRSLKSEDSDSWPAGDDLDGLIDGDVLDGAFQAKAMKVPADFGRD